MTTPELRTEIIATLRKVKAPSKVARLLGVDIRIVLPIADEMAGTPRVTREEQYGGEGRPDMRPYAVARKRAHDSWDNTDPRIATARTNYELGTHDMVTGRDGDWLILYSIPQQRVTPRPDYFRPEI